MEREDFFTHYLEYTANGEVPVFFHRWSAIVGLAAYLGRDFYFTHGHFNIHTNMYAMLIGVPGTRKSTAIKLMKKVLKLAGYDTIAANKTSKEKFMVDLSEGMQHDGSASANSILDSNLWGDASADQRPAECFIMADEFNNFIGTGNLEFISLLTELWDYEGTFDNKIKSGKSVRIHNPTISILGGNTPTGFSAAFPTDILGQGFFSRLLLIYGEPTGKRITFPTPPDPLYTGEIVERLQRIKGHCIGAVQLTVGAKQLIDKIYVASVNMHDVRFESYVSRRLNHLMKLVLVMAAARSSTTITEHDVRAANTILTHTEYMMPRALGEFGKARHSDVSHKIMGMIDSAHAVVTFKELWIHVRNDLERQSDLADLLHNLLAADKIQSVKNAGFLPKKIVRVELDDETVDWSVLTTEEKEMKK